MMETQAGPAKTRRGVKIVLMGSLALNLLFIGSFAGAAWRHNGSAGAHGSPGGGVQGYAAPYMRAMPRAERRALHNILREKHPQLSREARGALYQRMLLALRAEPFILDDVEAVLSDQSAAALGVQSSVQASWLNTIEQMTARNRLSYAQRLEEGLNRTQRKGSKDPRPRD